MKLSDLNNLTFDNIGTWPAPVKAAFVLIVCALIAGGGYYQFIRPQQEALAEVRQREQALKTSFEAKQRQAANLEALKAQLADMKESFGDMLQRLPNRTEVAGLLVDISQQGLGAGLEFELFKPGAEQPADFYAELPIQIRVLGSYHQFGTFVSGVADLPRIVTIHDVHIRRDPRDQSGRGLVMELVAKTYRYLDEGEEHGEAVAQR